MLPLTYVYGKWPTEQCMYVVHRSELRTKTTQIDMVAVRGTNLCVQTYRAYYTTARNKVEL